MKKKVTFDLIVIGSGGTGTYFLKEISRFLSSSNNAKDLVASMTIIDGDTVEGKNLSRQCFTEQDIGLHKASVMAEVLNQSFGLNWRAYTEYITDISQIKKHCEKNIPVIIGCVDNHAARLVCEGFFNSQTSCIFFDAANEYEHGEVVYSYKIENHLIGPLRSHYFPDILSGDLRSVTDLSCEELNQSQPQHILTNMTAGLALCSAFCKLLHGTVEPGVTFFNSAGFYAEFMPYTGQEDAVVYE